MWAAALTEPDPRSGTKKLSGPESLCVCVLGGTETELEYE